MKKLFIYFSFLAAISCTSNQDTSTSKVTAPEITPQEITSFDQIGDVYFGYLGVSSFPLEDGSFILSVFDPGHLAHISKDGKVLKSITKNGRGPNEFVDVGIPTIDGDENIYLYDRTKKAALVFDSSLKPKEEFGLASNDRLYVYRPHSTSEGKYLIEMSSIDWIINPGTDKTLILNTYDKQTEAYGKTLKLKTRQHALSPNPGPPAPTPAYAAYLGGDAAASYSDIQLYAFSQDKSALFIFNTGSSLIAELDMNLDTLRTIRVDLPTEEVSDAERDSIMVRLSVDDIRNSMQKLLPEMKTPAERMLIDWKGRFWLKSNLRGDTDKWYVLSPEGDIEKIVNLPKSSYLTHISEYHLGVRLDDTRFGLFESIN